VGVVGIYYGGEKQREKVHDTYGQTIAEICDPPVGGIASLANLPGHPNKPKILLLETDDTLMHQWHEDLPDEMRATSRETLDIVVCMKDSSETIETCDYRDDKKTSTVIFTIKRIQKNLELVLLNADSGLRIAELTVEGGIPDKCPDSTSNRKTVPLSIRARMLPSVIFSLSYSKFGTVHRNKHN